MKKNYTIQNKKYILDNDNLKTGISKVYNVKQISMVGIEIEGTMVHANFEAKTLVIESKTEFLGIVDTGYYKLFNKKLTFKLDKQNAFWTTLTSYNKELSKDWHLCQPVLKCDIVMDYVNKTKEEEALYEVSNITITEIIHQCRESRSNLFHKNLLEQ